MQNGDLLAPRRQERQVRKFNFFAAPSTLLRTCFASLREIFRFLAAALPLSVIRLQYFFVLIAILNFQPFIQRRALN